MQSFRKSECHSHQWLGMMPLLLVVRRIECKNLMHESQVVWCSECVPPQDDCPDTVALLQPPPLPPLLPLTALSELTCLDAVAASTEVEKLPAVDNADADEGTFALGVGANPKPGRHSLAFSDSPPRLSVIMSSI